MNVGELMVVFGLQPKGWDKGNALVKSLAGAAKRLIGIEAVRSVTSLVGHVTESATHLLSYSHAMGMAVQETQAWGYVAEQSGSSLKELSLGMNMFLRNVNEVRNGRGGKSLKQLFSQLGLDAEQQKKIFSGSTGLNDALLVMADRIKALGDKSKPLEATFTKTFGVRAGRAMLVDLARGSAGIKELMERRRAMGELDEKQATSLRDLGNRVKDLKTSFHALATTTLAAMAPALTRMAEAAGKWINENRELIGGALTAALKTVALLFEGIAKVVAFVGDNIRKAFAGDDGAIITLSAIAGVIGAVVVPAIYTMVTAFMAVAAPLIAIGTITAAIVALVIKLGPLIVKGVGAAVHWLKKQWDDFWDGLMRSLSAVKEMFTALGDAVVGVFEDAIHAIERAVDKGKEVLEDLNAWFHGRSAESLAAERENAGADKIMAKLDADRGVQRRKAEAQAAMMMHPAAMSAPNGMAAAAAMGALGPGGGKVHVQVNAPISINNKSPEATGRAVSDHLERKTRAAIAGVGGAVQ